MFSFSTFLPRFALFGVLTIALTGILLAASPAAAQQPVSGPRIPADAKGYQTLLIQQEYVQSRLAQKGPSKPPVSPRMVAARPLAAPSPTAAVPLTLAISISEPSAAPVTVAIQGPDGQVRNFPLEGGLETVKVRPVVVRAGESVTIRFPASEPPK